MKSVLGLNTSSLAVDSYGAWGKEASHKLLLGRACNPQVPAKVTGFFRPVLQLKHLLNKLEQILEGVEPFSEDCRTVPVCV